MVDWGGGEDNTRRPTPTSIQQPTNHSSLTIHHPPFTLPGFKFFLLRKYAINFVQSFGEGTLFHDEDKLNLYVLPPTHHPTHHPSPTTNHQPPLNQLELKLLVGSHAREEVVKLQTTVQQVS
jgi:hypothetical protein